MGRKLVERIETQKTLAPGNASIRFDVYYSHEFPRRAVRLSSNPSTPLPYPSFLPSFSLHQLLICTTPTQVVYSMSRARHFWPRGEEA